MNELSNNECKLLLTNLGLDRTKEIKSAMDTTERLRDWVDRILGDLPKDHTFNVSQLQWFLYNEVLSAKKGTDTNG